MKRKVAIFTGNRAEYGLQVRILKEIIKKCVAKLPPLNKNVADLPRLVLLQKHVKS